MSTTTNLNEIRDADVINDYFVTVTDNVGNKAFYIKNLDELEAWRVAQERANAWKPEKEKSWNPFEDTDIQMKNPCEEIRFTLDQNPKEVVGNLKPSMSAVPPIALFALGAAMQDGANKYGKFNWRDSDVKITVFYNAMMRHLEDWYAGNDYADDSGIHHLAHLMASAAILLDAECNYILIDDRNTSNTDYDRVLKRS